MGTAMQDLAESIDHIEVETTKNRADTKEMLEILKQSQPQNLNTQELEKSIKTIQADITALKQNDAKPMSLSKTADITLQNLMTSLKSLESEIVGMRGELKNTEDNIKAFKKPEDVIGRQLIEPNFFQRHYSVLFALFVFVGMGLIFTGQIAFDRLQKSYAKEYAKEILESINGLNWTEEQIDLRISNHELRKKIEKKGKK